MRRAIVLAAFLCSASLRAGTMTLEVTLNAGSTGFNSFAGYRYEASWLEGNGYGWFVTHVITNTAASYAGHQDANVWSENLPSHTTPSPPNCYQAMLNVQEEQSPSMPSSTQPVNYNKTTDPICYLGPPRPDPQPEPSPTEPYSPIVINLAGGYSLSGAEDPVLFDIDGDGSLDRIGWTQRGSDEAFLALDRNGDGRITSGSELFGTATPLTGGGLPRNGFEALRELDDNEDGRIDAADAVWASLLLWRDEDHDGTSVSSEIMPVAGSPLAALDLDYHWAGRRDASGNELRYVSKVVIEADGVATQRQVYDVFFIGIR